MNKITTDATRIIGVAAEYLKGITIKPVQPVFGAKPEKAFFILQAADNRIIGKTVFYLEMPEIPRLSTKGIGSKQQEGKYIEPVIQ